MKEIVLKGIPAASGIAYGPAFILERGDFNIPERVILDHEIDSEIARFQEALEFARRDMMLLKEKINLDMGLNKAQIFDAHLLVLEDPTLIEQVVQEIRNNKNSAEYIFSKVMRKYAQTFSKMPDEYLKERVTDINDITRRVLNFLMDEGSFHELDNLPNDLVIVAHDLSPSEAVSFYNKKIIAFVTDIGGRTSHTAIIAKSLGVPAVVGLKDATLKINNRDFLIVDGQKGLLIINPDKATKELYVKEQNKITESIERLEDIKDLPAQTIDGKQINLLANIELLSEIPSARKYGAEGIGLYRTEFLYMNRSDLPTEEEQFEAYKRVAEAIKPQVLTIRTLDIGGDKFISSVQIPKDMTPFLGSRAIRFCLDRPDIFKTQLRAILRASVYGKIQLMYPMISGIGELRQANAILEEIKLNLTHEKIPFDNALKVGVMIEVPSAVMVSDMLAKEVAFFSIGTNDLIQYALAVDRVNEKTAHLYEPAHPGVLRMIQKTIDAAHSEGIHVCLCGEMASDPAMALLLVGMGLDALSMSASSILTVKKLIRSLSLGDMQRISAQALQLSTGEEVEDYVASQIKRLGLS